MRIALPIFFFVLGVGLLVPRVTLRVWFVVGVWIMLVLAYNYVKP